MTITMISASPDVVQTARSGDTNCTRCAVSVPASPAIVPAMIAVSMIAPFLVAIFDLTSSLAIAPLVKSETVKISSFGTFSVRAKTQRIGRNPKTGQEVPIEPRRVLTFRPSHLMKERVDAGNKH